MKALRILVCVLATLALVGSAQGARLGGGDDQCRHVSARGIGQDLGGGNTTATITHGGILNGTTAAHFDITGGSPPVLTFAGTIVFTTHRGTLTASPTGTLNVATGVFNATAPITGGTGAFAGATGTLTFAGVEDLTTGHFTETITGTICLAHDD
jgi:hypothetical protein